MSQTIMNNLLFEQIVERATGSYKDTEIAHWREHFLYLSESKENKRFFHGTNHLIQLWTNIPNHTARDAAFVLYHDYIYYRKPEYSGYNEQKSAEYFRDHTWMWDTSVKAVIDGILATAHHEKDQDHLSVEIKYWLDGDLMELASPWLTYAKNMMGVMYEMDLSMDDLAWREGRSHWIESMLKRKRLFYFDDGTLDQNARANLQIELEMIRAAS